MAWRKRRSCCAFPAAPTAVRVGAGRGARHADHRGQRLNTLYRENITEPEILAALDPLLGAYAASRREGEGFGDFLLRTGVVDIPEKDRRHAPIDSLLMEEPA